jgi:hypothetical protein
VNPEPRFTAKAATKINPITARELSGSNIGLVISFDWTLPTGKTSARITGELRQIYHTAGETVLHLCSHMMDSAGEMDEFVLLGTLEITLEDL